MSAATPHSIALSARGAAWAADARAPAARSTATADFTVVSKKRSARFPGRFCDLRYFALPSPLVEGVVAVSLPGPVFGLAEPGPAVVPVVPEPLGLTALPEGVAAGALVAPPVAELPVAALPDL
jgi:hypothetical protein